MRKKEGDVHGGEETVGPCRNSTSRQVGREGPLNIALLCVRGGRGRPPVVLIYLCPSPPPSVFQQQEPQPEGPRVLPSSSSLDFDPLELWV